MARPKNREMPINAVEAREVLHKRVHFHSQERKAQNALDVYRTGAGAITKMRLRLAEWTDQGREIDEFFLRAMRGEFPDIEGRDRIVAAKELADRYYGKAVDLQVTAQLSNEQAQQAVAVSPNDLLLTIRKLKEELSDDTVDVEATPSED